MGHRVIHVSVSPQALDLVSGTSGTRNRAGRTLRDWLVHSFESRRSSLPPQTSLFSASLEVEDDVPLLLEALAQVTNQTPDELVESWARDESRPEDAKSDDEEVGLSPNIRGKVSELLDLGETLFEETVAHADAKLHGYPEGEKALQASCDVFRALRVVLGISDSDEKSASTRRGDRRW